MNAFRLITQSIRFAALYLSVTTILLFLAGCQPAPKPDKTVLDSVAKFRAGDLQGALAYFADNAIVRLEGLPSGQPDTYTGKEAIRVWWDELDSQNFDIEVTVFKVDGDTVTTKTLTWNDEMRSLGVAPLEATEVYVVKDGQIVSETWTLSEASLAKLVAVSAPAERQLSKPDEIVLAAMKGWDSDSVAAGQIDTTIDYFTDEATFKMVGFPPEIPAEFTGKEAIRATFESWMPLHPRLQVQVINVEGNTVTAKTLYWSDPTRGMGVAPLEGTDVYVIQDGKIASETWTLSEESQAKFQAAFAAAMAPSPTPNPYLAEIAGTYITELTKEDMPPGTDLVGEWSMEFTEEGLVEVYWGGDFVERGKFSISQGQLTFEATKGNSAGTYAWTLDGKMLTLSLMEDAYEDRVLVCTTHPLTRQE